MTLFLFAYIIKWEPHPCLSLYGVSIHLLPLLNTLPVSGSWCFLEDSLTDGKES